MSNETFVAYEYKNALVKRESVTMYTDCMANFGWTPVEEHEYQFAYNVPGYANPYAAQVLVEKLDGADMVTLQFKRDRKMNNKLEINKLERKCAEALEAISNMEAKNNGYSTGTSLGLGIVGAAFIGFAVYSFISISAVLGVVLTIAGFAVSGIGFLAYRKVGKKRSAQTEPKIQEQLEIAYNTCEQAHALLAV